MLFKQYMQDVINAAVHVQILCTEFSCILESPEFFLKFP